MAYLEEHSYIHQDLAARSIQVGDGGVCKVAEFSLARLIKDVSTILPGGTKFPLRWSAPEVLMVSQYSIKSDVWSFGILMYEIITKGALPYPRMDNRYISIIHDMYCVQNL